jgi:hypothetical protein
MKHQVIAGAGLAAVIAFCGYMIAQLDAQRASHQVGGPVATFDIRH